MEKILAEDGGTPVARRALDVLGCFDGRHRRLTLTEISERAQTPLATTHRLVQVLVDWGALVRGTDRRYEVGRRIWQLGLLADLQQGIRQTASPFLQDLFLASREAVFLAVRQGTSALYVERLTGVAAPRLYAQVGSRLPMHATGVGKVLLAYAPEEVVEHVMHHLRQYTPKTIVDAESLERELEIVRRRGFARTREELGLGSAAIAVPIIDSEGTVESALGIVSSDLRKDLSRLLPALNVTAQGIARSLPPRHGELAI